MNANRFKLSLLFLSLAILLLVFLSPAQNSSAPQTVYTAVNVPAGTPGNLSPKQRAFGNDFYVNRPITVWQLGVFDDLTNGINGGATMRAQLYSHFGGAGILLESLNFDAVNPGSLAGGTRFKPLPKPVTLLPGPYSILAYGFDATNRVADSSRQPYYGGVVPWTLDNGGGLIQFEMGRHGNATPNEFPHGINTNRPDFYAAASFTYSAATLPSPPYAADYSQLTAGVSRISFTGRRRSGSIALFDYSDFPVLVEPSGNRLVLEAAGRYNDEPNGGRCVVFAQSELGRYGDAREALFENAVVWASQKSNPADIVVGMSPLLNTNYFIRRGYQVVMLPTQMDGTTNTMPACDVMAVNWNVPFDDTASAQIAQFVAQGGGLVVTAEPWLLAHEGVKPALLQINSILQPFGLAYRPSTTIPNDLRFTNILAEPYPAYFSALPAAQLLGEDHLGQIQLDSLQKAIALNTINGALNVRPDLMEELTAISQGITNTATPQQAVSASSFEDVVTLSGSQASTNQLGAWQTDGSDIVATQERGVLEYDFTVSAADLYRLRIDGTQDRAINLQTNFDLRLSVDGNDLGNYNLNAPYGTVGSTYAFTPYLTAGSHTLRILWDNAGPITSFLLRSVHVQIGLGPASNGSVKDWVEQYVHSQSGMDLTNTTMTSYVSPVCLEGRDPYPGLMQVTEQSSQNAPVVMSAPNNRWYVNAVLPRDQNTPLIVGISHQNGVFSDWRQIQWLPVNVFDGASMTIRQGDSLLITAQPTNAPVANMIIIAGTNQFTVQPNPVACAFSQPGTYTVTGIYAPGSVNPQTNTMTVKVVGYQFPNNPDAWALNAREWDLTNVPPEVAFNGDDRMIFDPGTRLDNGYQTEVISDQNQPRSVLARLGKGGPILGSAQVNSFNFWSGEQTYTRLVQTYADGSQLIETLLVLSPVPSDLTIQMNIDAGGIMFTDGTTSKTFTASDFDSLGQLKVQFIRPAGAATSVCHSIRLYQNGVMVGQVQ